MSYFVRRIATVILLTSVLIFSVFAQPEKKLIEVIVTPTTLDWNHAIGDQIDFEISVLQNGQLLPQSKVSYRIGPEQMPEINSGELLLETGEGKVEGITSKKPGFIRCEATVTWKGKQYTGIGTAGIVPDLIKPVTELPLDFDTFWAKAKSDLSLVPMDAQVRLLPDQCTADINVFHVSVQNIGTNDWLGHSRFYGILSVPKNPGKYPAILKVPGAGARPYTRDDRASQNVIVFTVGIHGIPVNLASSVYQDLMKGAIVDYWLNKLDDRDHYYYKRVYLGCVRAIDFIYSLSEFDGENLAVTGGSQGGALSIVIAGLDERIDYLAAFYPALCDLVAYTEGQAGGWPHMFRNYDAAKQPAWIKVAPYYDVVNFARRIKIPGWYSWGYNDTVCPPTSMFAAFNEINDLKELKIYQETGHWTFPEQRQEATRWLLEHLNQN